ncbi:Oligopeptide ABC transporter substrate-binding protein [Metamycoplasma auris 15026]|uniref:Oligopeptide ABC transporter substrate-binding protein n=1 Tax=Metamycoplasma auris 15026 TaxID=1188233 RepID=N9VAQ5_9BACT|nr:hypothetical protein [Metamycoplasma auris]ENY68496.1 Oligopeptide ABC transporter substrate-binding protein [Metamycoplasma auris 15026]
MKKKSKISLLSALAMSAATIPLFVISCTTPRLRRFVFEYSSPYNAQAFSQDASRSYGAFQDSSVSQHTSVGLLRFESLNEPEVKHVDLKDNGGRIYDIKTYLTKPSFVVKRLGLASAVILTDSQNKIHVFDQDDYDMDETKSKEESLPDGKKIKVYQNPSVYLKSKNKRSINSDEFQEQLKKATKIQFTVRKDIPWVGEDGEPILNKEGKPYVAQAKDFYYSWLKTLSIKTEFRADNGGSEELDKEAQKALSDPSSVILTERQEYSNEYIFTLFGIDYTKFSKENEFIQRVADGQFKGQEAVTFEKLASVKQEETDFNKFLVSAIMKDYTFLPAPSQYIDATNEAAQKGEKLPVYSYIGKQTNETEAFEKKIRNLDKKSLMYISGSYWYGVSLKNTFYIGPYYILPQTGQELKLRKNKYYYDKEWVKREDTVDEIIQKYYTDSDPDTFARTGFNNYKQGSVSQISFSQLKPAQQSEILQRSSYYGLRFSRRLNKTDPFYRVFLQPFIKSLPKGNKEDFYGFNDAYAKLMFGGTRSELAKGTNDPQSYIAGDGLIFRTLLNAAINWNELASQATGGSGKAWLAKIADGSSIGGKDQDSAKEKTPGDVEEQINSLFAISSDGNSKLKFGDSEQLLPSVNDNNVKNISNKNDRLKSAGFKQIQDEIKKLFEKFDKENPNLKGQDFVYEYLFPYINIPATYKEAFNNIEKTFSDLNPRIKFKVFQTVNKDDPKFDAFRTGGANGTNLVSWGYDYDSIGSGYDGLSWNGNLVPTLTWIAAHDSDGKNKTFKTHFPSIHKLATEMVKRSENDAHKWVGSVPFKELHLVHNDFMGQRLSTTTVFEFKKDSSGHYVLQKDDKGNPKKWSPSNGQHPTDMYAWSAQFWLNYISSLTNEEAIKLMTEFTTFFNVDFSYGHFKQKNEFGRFLVQKHFIVPDDSPTGATIYADWRIKTKRGGSNV